MFKYILFLQLCNFVSNECIESTKYPIEFNKVEECTLAGYQTSLRMLPVLQNNYTEELYIKYTCIEVEDL